MQAVPLLSPVVAACTHGTAARPFETLPRVAPTVAVARGAGTAGSVPAASALVARLSFGQACRSQASLYLPSAAVQWTV